MKSSKSLKDIKFDFLKFFKPILIAILAVVVVAGLFLGIFGFNKGFDFTGGTQLVVEFPYDAQIQTDEGINKTSKEIKDILSNEGVKINSFQIQGEGYEKRFVITFKNKSESKIESIRLKINKQFNSSNHYADLVESGEEYKILEDEEYSKYDITRQTTYMSSKIDKNAIISTISTLLFALIIAMIYALIRLKTASALTMVFAGILNVILTMAFIVFARIEINTYFFSVLAVVLMVSVYNSADYLFSLKQALKNPVLTDKTNYDLANIVVKNNLKKYIIIYSSIAGVVALFGIFGVLNILHTALTIITGLVVCFATHLFVIPAFWSAINKKRELSKPAIAVNDIDSTAEEIVIEENSNDENAEEVVIEEENKD